MCLLAGRRVGCARGTRPGRGLSERHESDEKMETCEQGKRGVPVSWTLSQGVGRLYEMNCAMILKH